MVPSGDRGEWCRRSLAGLVTLFFTFLSLSGMAGCGGDGAGRAEPATPPLPTVSVSRPVVESFTDAAVFDNGTIEAIERVRIRARVSGYLQEVFFEEGQLVKTGDPLFLIDPRPYENAVAQAKGDLARAQAAIKKYDADLVRAQQLIAKRAMSKEEYDQTVAQRNEAAAAVESLQAQLAQAELNLEFTRIHSPITGIAGRVLIRPGNLIAADSASTDLTTIVSVDPIHVYFAVNERDALDYRRRARAQGHTEIARARFPIQVGLDDEPGRFPHEGTIDFIDNQLDRSTGTILVRGLLPNPDQIMKPGNHARVRVPLGEARPRVLISERAIFSDQGQPTVYVLDADNKVQARAIETGSRFDGLREVVRGLNAEETLVVNGLQRIRPGVTVNPNPVEMPRSARFGRNPDADKEETKAQPEPAETQPDPDPASAPPPTPGDSATEPSGQPAMTQPPK